MFSLINKKQGVVLFAIVFIFAGIFLFTNTVKSQDENDEEDTNKCLDWSSYFSSSDSRLSKEGIQKCKDNFSGVGRTYSWEIVEERDYCYDVANGESYCCPLSPSCCPECIIPTPPAPSPPPTPTPPPTTLIKPTIIYPKENAQVYAGEIELKWSNTGAAFYKYHVETGGEIKEEKTIGYYGSKTINDLVPGNYSWAVCSCNDTTGENCNCSDLTTFQVVFAPAGFFGGIVPCGRKYDDPNTPPPQNESVPCEYKHVFLLLKNILDFILWQLGLIVLVLLILAVGVIYYFSMGAPSTMVGVKSILKSAGIGYGIMFLAWLFINLILSLLGYQISIFGRWWQIPF